MGGKVGSCRFVIVSAWFLCGTDFKTTRIIKIVKRVLFYGILLNLLFMVISRSVLRTLDFVHGLSYWFPFAYIAMLCAIPTLNRIVKNSNYIIFIILCIMSIIGFWAVTLLFPQNLIVRILSLEQISGSACFCCVYIFTYFIKKNDLYQKGSWIRYFISAVALYLIMYILFCKFRLIGVPIPLTAA